jgi:surface antigen
VAGMRFQMVLVGGLLALSGCVTGGPAQGPLAGPVQGSAAGGRGAVASTILGEMGGGLISGAAGAGLGRADRRVALEAEYRTLEYTPAGKAVTWQSGGTSGEVVAAQPYRVGSQDCRQYMHAVSANGQKQTARGTACRNPDGSWTPLT